MKGFVIAVVVMIIIIVIINMLTDYFTGVHFISSDDERQIQSHSEWITLHIHMMNVGIYFLSKQGII